MEMKDQNDCKHVTLSMQKRKMDPWLVFGSNLNRQDNVNHPPHYKQGDVECIDAIKSAVGGGFEGYCIGNAMKYLWRYKHKGAGKEDLQKAVWYIQKVVSDA